MVRKRLCVMRTPSVFRQRDVTRALKAAAAAGLHVVGFKIDPQTGAIAVEVGSPEAQGDAPARERNEWDSV
jgi:hypothetical protein